MFLTVFHCFSHFLPKSESLLSLFTKERQEQFAFGKEQITILLFHSQKTSNLHKKPKNSQPIQNHIKHSLSHISPKPSLHISSKPYRNSKLSISQGWKFALSLFTLLLKKLLSLQSDHERFALVTRASCSFLRANCTFAFLLSKNEQFASKICCFRHVFDSFSLLFPVFCPRVSLFCKERQEGFAFGKEQIAILLFHSQKMSNLHKKPKSEFPTLAFPQNKPKHLLKYIFSKIS